MDNKRIWLSSPHMGGHESDFVQEAFDTNWVAPLGPNVNGFEKDLTEYVGIKSAGALASGTAAIHLALILLGIKEEDEVICQSFTFSASANPICYQKATPIFVDSELDTWNIDPELLEQVIKNRIEKGKKPKAMIVVHLYGMPAKMDQIIGISNKYNIPIIEDAAEALGSYINNRKCGSFGKLSVLSFNGNKIITTSGGGAILSNETELIEKARFLATQARDEAPHYQHSAIGYNYRMSNILAGIGRGQMKVLDERINRRREIHQLYFNELGKTWLEVSNNTGVPKIINNSTTNIYFLKEPENYFSNRWLTTIIIDSKECDGVSREDIRLELERNNIESRPLWKPMHLQPVFKNFPHYSNKVSDWLFEKGLCLPSGSNMEKASQKRVIEIIKSVIK